MDVYDALNFIYVFIVNSLPTEIPNMKKIGTNVRAKP